MDKTTLQAKRERRMSELIAEQQRIRDLRAALDVAATNEQRLVGAVATLDELLTELNTEREAATADEQPHANDSVG